ncbi:hypothetical protein FB45DRAFT_1068538 [Roridomyces roridus]|uniref:Uncharacterized protein n=1 Tax=Roridomyces roridus TaxID=1738132 RepID=A0AAD7B0G9_9AGAR|nr:hypothetical protein FB45DRAFT_1068538 [Roridomyces roridus]
MHPSLSPAALNTLPFSLRRTAVAAAKGSLKDFTKLVKDLPPSFAHSPTILPACYGQLDPIQAERFERLDFITTRADALHLFDVFLAMEHILVLSDIPKGCYPDLWPRLWRWSLLVIRHNYCLPYTTRQGFLLTFISLFARIHRNCDATAQTINATPGFRQLVARVWVLLSRKSDQRCADGARDDILDLIHYGLDLTNPEHLNELIEGCGGNLVHFADVLVNFFTNLASDNVKNSLRLMEGAFSLMALTMDMRPEFPHVLYDRGWVCAVVLMLRRIASHSLPTEYALEEAYRTLMANILRVPSEELIVEAVKAGFLQLIASALQNPLLIPASFLDFALMNLLCAYLPYRSVLARLRSAIVEVDATMDVTLASRSPVWETWTMFHDIVNEMLNTLKIHRAPSLPPTRACDNIESPNPSSLLGFTDCAFLESPDMITMQSSRDESFFRTVTFATYHNSMPFILLEELSYMLKHPDQPLPFVTFLNFDGGGVAVGGLTDRNLAVGREIFGPMWDDQTARAAAPRGQNHLQLIVILCAIVDKRRATHLFAIPKPRGLREALVALAKSGDVPPGVVDVAQLGNVSAVTDRIDAIVKDQDLTWLDRPDDLTPSRLLCAPVEGDEGRIRGI